ncbi:MAG: hypothetical protein ABJ205_15110 [Erythrobacter sp.]|uniref:hypothetical protein n=1 Tax=Erythrobacter sp. TaxID=1042 RepID=UPI0032638BC0
MINRIIKVLVLLPAVLFVFTGVRWLVTPGDVAATLGLDLGEGLGRSSLIGDMSGFFLTVGSCMLIALITQRRTWYYPPIMLLGITALGRTIAWLIHDAALAVPQIMVELVVAGILLAASRRLPQER